MLTKNYLKSLLLLLCMISGVGTAWGDEEPFYTLDGTITTGGNSNYAQDGNGLTQGDISWSVTGNTTINPWRIGGKNLTAVDREAYSKTAMGAAISKVDLEIGDITLKSVNSITLTVASNSDFSNVIETIVKTSITANTTLTFEPSGSEWAKDAYYKLAFNVTAGSSNSYIQLKSAKFYKKSSAPAYIITAQSNNNDFGTVSLSGSVITGSPNDGYRYATPAYSVTSGTATVAQDGNAFTVTPSSDCTVQINFEAIPTHTATFSVNGNTTTQDFEEGANIVFPSNPADVNGKKFMGWVTEAIEGTTNEEPSFVTSATMSTNDVTYYAVFATVTPGTAQDASVTINTSTANLPTSYGGGNKFTEYTLDGVKFKIQQMYKNGSKLQWRADGNSNGAGTMYNTEALQNIQSVVITYDDSDNGKNFTLKVGDSENPTSGTAITPSNEGNVYTYDCSGYNKNFFVLANGEYAGYLTYIVINYQTGTPDTYSAYCTTVAAAVAVTSVTLDQTSKALFVGDEFDLTATITPDNATVKTVTWTSSDETKATVVNGHVTALAAGTPTITVTTTDGSFTATCELTISNVAVTGVSLNKDAATIYTGSVGNTVQLTPTIAPANATIKTVLWESSDEDVATVDENGLVTAVAEGTATITVTTTDGSFTATCVITVETAPGSAEKPYTIAQAREAIDANEGTENVYVKGIVSQVGSYSNNKYITYWISDDGTKTNHLQVYKGLGIDGVDFSAATDITVGDKVVVKGNITLYNSTTYEFEQGSQLVSKETLNFAFDEDSYEVECGGDLTITASSNNSSGAITYSSSATDVAEINASTGVVTAKKEGETTITATIAAADGFPGKSIDVTLTVTDSREAASITFANAEVFALDTDGEYTQVATVAQGDYDGNISYEIESSTSDGALVDDATGELLFDKKGTIVVKATAGETATYKSNTATYTLKVRTTPTIVVSNQSIAYGEIYTFDAASNVEGGAVTITSSNEMVVEVDEYDMGGVAVGTSTITVATAANDEYIAGSETFVLTVTAPVGQSTAAVAGLTTTFKDKDLRYDGDGMDWEASHAASSFETSGSARGVQFGAAIGEFTLTSSASNVTKVSMVLSTNGSNNTISVTVGGEEFTTTYGDIDETKELTLTSGMSKETVEFVGSGSGTITISVSDGNKSVYFKSITVTSEIAITLNASGYATYCSQYPLDFTTTNGYTAWQIKSISGETITFEKITGAIKGGQGILLKGDAGATVTLASVDSDEELSENLLYGTTAPTYVADDEYFGLSGNKFVKINAGTVPAGKALLPASEIPAEARELTFMFEDGQTTGIESLNPALSKGGDTIYDLQGRKVAQPTKGLYIKNGKKVVMK